MVRQKRLEQGTDLNQAARKSGRKRLTGGFDPLRRHGVCIRRACPPYLVEHDLSRFDTITARFLGPIKRTVRTLHQCVHVGLV
jgi:hypothetical protein